MTRKPGEILRTLVPGTLGILGFLVLWEAAPRLGVVDPRFLPPASEVLGRLGLYLFEPAFWGDVASTMRNWAVGLFIASAAAIVLGVVIGSSRFLRAATRSTIEFLRPIPSVALIPLAVLLFGTRMESTVLLIVYAAFWQVLLQVLAGVADLDPVADDTARVFGLGRASRVRYVIWPTTLPYLMTGLRLGAAVALILAITGELVIGTPGLGKQIALTQSGGQVAAMYALVVAAGAIGVLINAGARVLERRVLAWHSSVRGEVLV